jgi:hypothetical protein
MKFKSTLINDVCYAKGTNNYGEDEVFFRNGERITESEYLKAMAEKINGNYHYQLKDTSGTVFYYKNEEQIPESEYLKAMAEKAQEKLDEYFGEIGIEKKGWKLLDNDDTAIIETADIKLFIPKEIFNEFVKFWQNKIC